MLEEVLEKKSWLEEVGESDLPVAVYGMGNGADKLFAFLERRGIRLDGENLPVIPGQLQKFQQGIPPVGPEIRIDFLF